MSKLDPAVKLYRQTKRQRAAVTRPAHTKLMRAAQREFERQTSWQSNNRALRKAKRSASA